MIKNFPRELVCDYFVETGTLHGDGVMNALNIGFKNVISIEIYEPYFQECVNRYKNYPDVTLYKGDTSLILYDCIKDINDKITFWLDAHVMDHNTFGTYITGCPLLRELENIKKHHMNTHTIIIDDLRILNSPEYCVANGWEYFGGEDTLVDILYEINPNYTGYHLDGAVSNDILVVTI